MSGFYFSLDRMRIKIVQFARSNSIPVLAFTFRWNVENQERLWHKHSGIQECHLETQQDTVLVHHQRRLPTTSPHRGKCSIPSRWMLGGFFTAPPVVITKMFFTVLLQCLSSLYALFSFFLATHSSSGPAHTFLGGIFSLSSVAIP